MQPLTDGKRLPERVADALRGHVTRELAPGRRLESVRVLAERLGVSVATVRAAQGLLQREGLLVVRQGSGAWVTDRCKQKWVAIVSELDIFTSPPGTYIPVLVRASRKLLKDQGLNTQVYVGRTQPGEINNEPSCGRFEEDLQTGRLNGAILASAPDTAGWARLIREAPVPLVGTGTRWTVSPDYEALVHAAIAHLARQGCRRLALMGWGPSAPADAFVEAARKMALTTTQAWVRRDLHPRSRGAGWSELREIWAAHREKPDGLLVLDDALLPDVAIALQEMRIAVPNQLRVIATTHESSDWHHPLPVSLMHIDVEAAADSLVSLLLQRMGEEPRETVSKHVPFSLIPEASIEAARSDIVGE